MQGIVIGMIATCFAVVTAVWQYSALPATKAAAPPVSTLAPAEPEDQGTVHIGTKLDAHWSNWNGEVALIAHRTAVPRVEGDLAGKHLLVPSFTYGPLKEATLAALHERAARFAADSGMTLEEESRGALFHARFMEDPSAVALVPENLSTALGLDSAASVQRLTLVAGGK